MSFEKRSSRKCRGLKDERRGKERGRNGMRNREEKNKTGTMGRVRELRKRGRKEENADDFKKETGKVEGVEKGKMKGVKGCGEEEWEGKRVRMS